MNNYCVEKPRQCAAYWWDKNITVGIKSSLLDHPCYNYTDFNVSEEDQLVEVDESNLIGSLNTNYLGSHRVYQTATILEETLLPGESVIIHVNAEYQTKFSFGGNNPTYTIDSYKVIVLDDSQSEYSQAHIDFRGGELVNYEISIYKL